MYGGNLSNNNHVTTRHPSPRPITQVQGRSDQVVVAAVTAVSPVASKVQTTAAATSSVARPRASLVPGLRATAPAAQRAVASARRPHHLHHPTTRPSQSRRFLSHTHTRVMSAGHNNNKKTKLCHALSFSGSYHDDERILMSSIASVDSGKTGAIIKMGEGSRFVGDEIC